MNRCKVMAGMATGMLLCTGWDMAVAATHVAENIQNWTARAAYGTWTQSIPAGTVNMTQCIVAPTAAANGVCTVGRVQMQASTGILELPAVNTAGAVSFNIVAGGTGRSVKLQKNVGGGGWVDVATFSGIGTTGATYSHDVNESSASIALRLAVPSAALYVHDIQVDDYVFFAPPAFGANPGPLGATVGVARAFAVAASGSPAPALALQGTTASGGYSFTPATGILNYTPPLADADTTKTFTFTASNSAGVATQVVSVAVVDAAVVPVFTSGTSYGATTSVAMVFTVTASGNPAPTLVLRSQTATSGFSFTPATGVLGYTPPTGDVGTRTFTFTASNSAGVATQVVSVAVAAPPVTIPTVSIADIGTQSFTVNWTACDGATEYQVQIATDTNFTAGGGGGGLFISQYYEGAGNDKWIELFNAGDGPVDLSAAGLRIGIWANEAREAWKTGTAPNSSIVLSGTIAAGGTYLVRNSSAANPAYATANLSSGSLTFNGDDSVVLYAGSTYSTGGIVDSIGLAGSTHVDTSIVRKSTVLTGNTSPSNLNASEWDAYAYAAVDAAMSGNPERLGEHMVSGGTGGSLVRNETVAALTVAAAGLDQETTYFVRARQAGGEWSDVVSATTASPTPTIPQFGANPGPLGATTDVAVAFTVSASGVPLPELALQGTTASGGSYGFTAGTGLLSYTPPVGDAGTRTFSFTASNSQGVATQTVSVVVDLPPETVPVFGANPGPVSATVGVAVAFTVGATGNPTPSLALQSQTATAGFSFTPATGLLNYTPPAGDVGARTFTFTAGNTQGVATQIVTVSVAPAPVYIPTVAVTNNGTNSFTVLWTEVTDAAIYQVQVATDTNFTAESVGATVLAEDFATLTDTTVPAGWTTSKSSDLDFTGEPLVGEAPPAYKFGTTGQWLTSPTFATGATNLQFWAYGRNGAGSTYTISGLVAGVWTRVAVVSIARNDATYNVPLDPQTTRIKFTFTRVVNCALDDIVIQSAAASGSVVMDESVAALTYGATGLELDTTYHVRVRAAGGTWSEAVPATTLGNDPVVPWFTGGTGPYNTTAGVAVAFTVSAMGVPAPALGLANATATAGSHAFTADTGYFIYMPPLADAGTQAFTFIASNSTGVATQVVEVAVVPATAPAFILLGTQHATTLVANVFYVEATGAPEPELSLAGTTASAGYSFSPDTGRLAYTAPTNDTGAQTFTFTASNIAGVATQIVDVVVSNAPAAAPVINPIPPQSTMVGLMFSYTVTATDPDTPASNLTFACTSAVDTNRWDFDTATGYFLFEPTTNQIGTNVFTFTATDSPTLLSSPPSNMVVVVNAVGDPVSVSFGQARMVGEEGQGSLSIPIHLAYLGNAAMQFRFVGPTNGTARRGVDFNCSTTLVVSGASSGHLVVDIVNDFLPEGPESVIIQLAPVSPATAGAITQMVLHIRDKHTVSVMAANTTSGSYQEYEGPGNRIFQALCPDVVLIQEFNMTNGTSAAAYRAWVDQNFGPEFHYGVQPGVSIPNGVVSRWPISDWGVWDDTTLSDRDFVWAQVELPGEIPLYAVSVHLKASSGYESQRTAQARALTNLITQAGWLTNGYVVIAGDFNLQTRTETALAVLTTKVTTDTHQSADQNNNKNTNSGRDKPYDLVLPSTNLDARHRTFSLYGYTYPNGIVYDSRITWANGLPPPSISTDSSAANMQHMAAMKIFELEQDLAVDEPQAFSAIAAGAGQIDVAFTRNTLGDDVVVVGNNTGVFSEPSGTPPAVGLPFAGGTLIYKGGTSPQSHAGLSSCSTYFYKCWSYAGDVYSEVSLADSAETSEPAAPASVWAAETNDVNFIAAWSEAAGASAYRLDVCAGPSFSGTGAGWNPVFRETMGTSAGTTTLAAHDAADGFDNDVYTMTSGGADVPADVRSTSVSSNYVDLLGGTASGGANIYFTTTGVSSAMGFAIEGIDTRGFESLDLSFGYRKESATTNMWLSVEWSTDAGETWNPITVSNMPAEDAAIGWHLVSGLAVPAGGAGATNLGLRWVRPFGGQPGRIDDVLLRGFSTSSEFVPGYSNRAVSATTSQMVTGVTAGATYYFRVAALGACTGSYSAVATATTRASFTLPVFDANPGPVAATAGVAMAFTVSASGDPAPALALGGTTATSGYAFEPQTGELSYVPVITDIGNRSFTFTASNAAGVATQVVSVSVAEPPPEAPVFTSASAHGATTRVAMVFTVAASGYPLPVLALRSTTASGGYEFTAGTGQLAFTPPEADWGAHTFTFTASNSAGVATQSVAVTVAAGLPSAPASVWAVATNASGFTAAWTPVAVAASYRLDVSEFPSFEAGSGDSLRSVLASNGATVASVAMDGWTAIDVSGSTYAQLLQSSSVVVSPAFSTVGCTNLTVDMRARTFGGASGTSSNITVSISTNNGIDWTVVGVVAPWINTMNALPTLTNTANLGYAETRIRWQTLGATGTIGVGLTNLVVQGWAPASSPSYVPGYSNRMVAGTSEAVTGLAEDSTYYFRVRAANDAGTSANSATASATTAEVPPQNQAISFPAIGAQVATNTLELSAVASSGLTVTFAVGSGPATISGGTSLSFTGAGTVSLVASQAGDASWNPAPSVTNTFTVAKALAGVTLSNLSQEYDGTPKSATVETTPAGLAATVTYDGNAGAPSAAGSYEVVAIVVEALYSGGATGTLMIAEAMTPFELWLQNDQALDPEDSRYAPDADDDGDGMTTYEEYLADTDPANANSVLELTGRYWRAGEVGGSTGQIRFSFPASPNRYYQLEYCTGLKSRVVGTTNLGWGVPGMVVTNSATGTWYGVIRVFLQEP